MTPVLAIADEHGRGVLKTLTLREQRQYLERILLCPPSREVQILARQAFEAVSALMEAGQP